jgi:hypothetical protein
MLQSPLITFSTLLMLALFAPGAVFAGSPGPDPLDQTGTPPPQVSSDEADEGLLQPAEPDYRLVNLPTTLRLPLHKGSFDLTHRFAGNLRRGTFRQQASDFFGLDQGATIGFEYRYAVVHHLQAAAYRSSFNKTVQFYAKYDARHQQSATPLSLSALVSVEGTDNFHSQYAPAIGGVVSRTLGTSAALYAVPTWVHHSAAAIGVDRDTFYVGLGGRLRIGQTVYVAAEVSPRAGGYAPGKPEFGFAIEKRAGGHMFQLNFTNTFGTTFGQIARGGFPTTLYLGFNLARKFY